MKIQTNIKNNKRKVLCLVLLSTMLHGCVGGTGSDSTNGNQTQPSNYLGDGVPGEEHAKPDKDQIKDKEKRKKELYEKLKNHGTASINQRAEIDKILSKLPLHLLDAHHEKAGTIEFVAGDWKSSLNKYGIDTNQEFMDYTGKTIGAQSLAHAVEINGELKLLVRADEGINYANDGDNRKRLYYAAVKGLISVHDVETDAELVALLKEAQGTPGARYLDHPSISELLNLANENTLNEQNREAAENSLAYLLANYAEDPEIMGHLLPEVAEHLDKFDNEYQIINMGSQNNLNQWGTDSRDLGWFTDNNSCGRVGGICVSKKFTSEKSNVIGYEWEARQAKVGKLLDEERKNLITMDIVLAKSGNVDGVEIPAIALVVERNEIDKEFIEIVTGPTPTEEILSKEYHSVISMLVKLLTTKKSNNGKSYTITNLISDYNEQIKTLVRNGGITQNFAQKYMLTIANEKEDNQALGDYKDLLKDVEINITGAEAEVSLYQQANVMVDVVKIFTNPKFAENYLFKGDIGKSGYVSYLAAQEITNKILKYYDPSAQLSNYAKAFLVHTFYNLFCTMQSRSKHGSETIVLKAFFRHSPEDMLYSVLPEEDIKNLKKMYKSKGFKDSMLLMVQNIAKYSLQLKPIPTKIQLDPNSKDINDHPGDISRLPNGKFVQTINMNGRHTVINFKTKTGQNENTLKDGLLEESLKETLPGPKGSSDYLRENKLNIYFRDADLATNLMVKDQFFKLLEEGFQRRKDNKPFQLIHNAQHTSIDICGRSKTFRFPDDNVGRMRNYNMPKSWGHEPLINVKGKGQRIYCVLELRSPNGINNYNLTSNLFGINSFNNEGIKKFYEEMEKLND